MTHRNYDNRGTISFSMKRPIRITEALCNFIINMFTRLLIDALIVLSIMIMIAISFLDPPPQDHGEMGGRLRLLITDIRYFQSQNCTKDTLHFDYRIQLRIQYSKVQ